MAMQILAVRLVLEQKAATLPYRAEVVFLVVAVLVLPVALVMLEGLMAAAEAVDEPLLSPDQLRAEQVRQV
jgi:hypothetical protein